MGIVKKSMAQGVATGSAMVSNAQAAPAAPRTQQAPAPRSSSATKLTDEQRAVVDCNGRFIVVNAYAGTGKTSTLKAYTEARPHERFLYAAFNKGIQMEAASKFPSNTVAQTTHSMAWNSFGRTYQPKLGNLKPFDIASRFGLPFQDAKRVVDTLSNFICSADARMDEQHLPEEVRQDMTRARVFDSARRAWQAMCDTSDPLTMPHDGYLKLFALSKPDFSGRFDTILFDEAQDANPVTAQILLNQPKCRVLMVGDRYQSIYGFRGAENAMESANASDAFYLTNSFRFGKGVATIATGLLEFFRNAKHPIIGRGKHQETEFLVDRNAQHAILCRTNGGIFERSVECVRANTPFCLITGVDNYQFDRILDVYRLYSDQNHEIRDNFLKRFGSFGQLEEYANTVEDKELTSMIKIVHEHGNEVQHLVREVKTKAIPDSRANAGRFPSEAQVLLTTAHRSKGLEFDQVILNGDFSPLLDDETGLPIDMDSRDNREEVHLAYVAVTRAERALELNGQLKAFLDFRSKQVNAEVGRQMSRAIRPHIASPSF